MAGFRIEEVPASSIMDPGYPYFEIRFPQGAIDGVTAALVSASESVAAGQTEILIAIEIQGPHSAHSFFMRVNDETSQEPLKTLLPLRELEHESPGLMQAFRVCIAAILLQQNPEMVEPDVFADDREKYDGGDEATKTHLREKARRRRGRIGFQLGRKCEVSPHWRMPHLHTVLFGPGKVRRRLTMYPGVLVRREKLTEVPTEFRGTGE
ncbi:hypothetical protein SH661x_002299 [Planctomicrobium sp. SH661]|uniref:hypothetical protein n=1 Tax=Planctomicrobium sp. SH661 TaxID=3448124 RepID=UPI003F5B39BE